MPYIWLKMLKAANFAHSATQYYLSLIILMIMMVCAYRLRYKTFDLSTVNYTYVYTDPRVHE